jgi:hypothetical protein
VFLAGQFSMSTFNVRCYPIVPLTRKRWRKAPYGSSSLPAELTRVDGWTWDALAGSACAAPSFSASTREPRNWPVQHRFGSWCRREPGQGFVTVTAPRLVCPPVRLDPSFLNLILAHRHLQGWRNYVHPSETPSGIVGLWYVTVRPLH